MDAGSGEIANDLRAQVRYWQQRLPKSARLITHMQRAAQLIEAAVRTGPRKGLIKRLKRASDWMREHAQAVAHWQFVFGATQLSTSLYRAMRCLHVLAVEAENAS
ncbi:MAG: hypothetical protein JJU24_08435 [Natronohydrobacter sp.]|nr:hypothetical protein [Natronohydrobacter sp.]